MYFFYLFIREIGALYNQILTYSATCVQAGAAVLAAPFTAFLLNGTGEIIAQGSAYLNICIRGHLS